MVKIKFLKHYENLLQVKNEVEYVKNTIVKSDYVRWASFPNGNCNKITKIKNDAIITTYKQIFVKNTP